MYIFKKLCIYLTASRISDVSHSSCIVAPGLSGCGTRPLEIEGLVVASHGLSCLWDLISPTKDRTHIPCIGRQVLNHRTTREVPKALQFLKKCCRGNNSVLSQDIELPKCFQHRFQNNKLNSALQEEICTLIEIMMLRSHSSS